MPSRSLPQLTVVYPVMSRHTLPVAAQITMSENAHQIAALTVLTPLDKTQQALDARVPSSLVLPEGTPVCLRWGSSPTDTALWYGYVASRQIQTTKAQTSNPAAPVVPVLYTLTGISMFMQSPSGLSLTGASVTSAARAVIGKYNLASYIAPHPRIWPALAQGTASDFTWLCRLAAMIGYRLIVDTDRIFFAPAATDLTPVSAVPPLYTRSLQPGVWDSLIAFDPSSGQTDPTGGVVTGYTAYAVRPTSGTPAQASGAATITGQDGSAGTPTFTRIALGTAQSLSDAQYTASASVAASRYWVYASATVDGTTTLRPGRTVSLAGPGLGAAQAGLWRVGTVTHAVTLSALGQVYATYYAHLELGRDQTASLSLTPASPPLSAAAAPVLTGGRWITPGATR